MLAVIWLQQAAAPITVPDNIVVWGNISLALLFNILVALLRAVGIIKDDSATKKMIGGYLAAVGGVVGLVYAFSSGVTDVVQIITLAAGGALSGVTSVGFHSSVKNAIEGFKVGK